MSDTSTFTPPAPDGQLPNGKDGIKIKCPHCGAEYLVQYPSSNHLGAVRAECGCGAVFEYDSPHGPAPFDWTAVSDTTGLNALGQRVDEDGNPVQTVVGADGLAVSREHVVGQTNLLSPPQ